MLQTLALVCGQMAIGAAAIFGRFALHGTGGWSACAWRMVLASAGMWLLTGRRSAPTEPRTRRLLTLAGLVLALHFATWVQSLTWLPVAPSSLLVSTSPLWNSLYETLVLRRPSPWQFWLALALALAGTALMLDVPASALAQHNMPGVLCALTGAACMAAYVVIIARVHADHAAAPPLDVSRVVRHTYTVCAAALLLLCAVTGSKPPPLSDAESWGGIVGMAGISQMVGHTLMNRAVQFFAPGTVTLTTLLKPLFASVLAALVFHERLTAPGYAGALLVFIGLALTVRYAQHGDVGPARP